MAAARPGGGEGGPHRRAEPVLLGDPGSTEQVAQLSGLVVLAMTTVGGVGLVGSALFLLAPADVRPAGYHPLPIAAVSAMVVATAWLGRRRPELFSRTALVRLLPVAAVLLAVTAGLAGPVTSPLVTMFFVWYASSVTYLPRRVAVALMAWAAAVHATLLVVQPGHFEPVVRWVTTIGIMVTTAVFMNRLVERAWALAHGERAARAQAEWAKTELEVVSAHKSGFLARMSHELRTPLNAIIGFSEVLARRSFGDLNPKQSQYVADVVDSGRHLLALVDDVLDLAKVETGSVELDVRPVNVAGLLAGSLALFNEQAGRQGVNLRLDVGFGLEMIEADARKLKQVVFNLLSNAVKFTPAGGEVTLGARRTGDSVRIWVADTGRGIAPDDRETIFEEFRQGAREGNGQGGTGLGLPLARRLVELHGGRLGVETEPGSGSTFTAELPVRARPEGARNGVSPPRDDGPVPMVLGEPDTSERRAETARLVVILAVGMTGLAMLQVLIFQLHPVPELAGYRALPFACAVGMGLAIALAALVKPHWLGAPATFPYLTAVAIVNLSAGAYLVGPGVGDFIGLFYVCTGAAVLPILTSRVAIAEVVLLGAGYGSVLALTDGYPVPLVRWAVVLVFVIVSGLIFRRFVTRIEALALAERAARAETERVAGELEVASRHKTEFLANMSHELRTPLNVVNGFSEVLASEAFGPLNAKQAEYAADVLASGRHLLGLINDILDLAKADAGRMELQVSQLDLGVTLASALLPFQEAAFRRRIELSVQTGPGRVEADEAKLFKALGHLVSNALKFTPDGGRVMLRAAQVADHVEISVTDTGRGIDPDDHQLIFDAFAHGDHDLATEQGSGLGLALARRYAELHGGSLTVRSDVGLGAVFTLSLPLPRAGIEPAAPVEVA